MRPQNYFEELSVMSPEFPHYLLAPHSKKKSL